MNAEVNADSSMGYALVMPHHVASGSNSG
jgi:hypothetical protein